MSYNNNNRYTRADNDPGGLLFSDVGRLKKYNTLINHFIVIMLFFILGSSWLPQRQSNRILTGCWLCVCIVLAASYQANLVSFLTVDKPPSMVDSIEKLIAHPEYQILLRGGGATESEFKVKMLYYLFWGHYWNFT